MLKSLVLASTVFATGTAMAGVTFYEGEGFQGRPLTLNASSDFRAHGYNDRARSMVVQGSPVEVCVDIHYAGGCQVFGPGEYPTLGQWTDTISSVRPATFASSRGYQNRYYDDRGYRGDYRDYNRDYRDYRDYNRDYNRDYYRDSRRDNPLNELRSLFGF